jgi:hypothetical protein
MQRYDKYITTQEDPYDPLTNQLPMKPVTFVEGTSYIVVIFDGLSIVGAAMVGVAMVYLMVQGNMFLFPFTL